MTLPTFRKRHFIVCVTTRPDLLPTGYYNSCGKLVRREDHAATFKALEEVLKFVEDHKITLGETSHIGLSVNEQTLNVAQSISRK